MGILLLLLGVGWLWVCLQARLTNKTISQVTPELAMTGIANSVLVTVMGLVMILSTTPFFG